MTGAPPERPVLARLRRQDRSGFENTPALAIIEAVDALTAAVQQVADRLDRVAK